MSSARRSLLTATAAGTLLGALWFVPSANATADKTVQQHRADTSAASSLSTMSDFTRRISVTTSTKTPTTTTTPTSESALDSGSASDSADGTRLADTGSFDTTPYVVGGTLCLGLGAGFVVYSLRRERLGF